MHRARVILTPLIPALWLVASVNCLFDPGSGKPPYSPGCFLCAAGRQGPEAAAAAGALDQSARRWSRRLDDQAGAGTPSPVTFCRGQDFHLARAAGGAIHSHVLPALAQGWQFHWRTAAEPRAPSTIA